MICWASFSRCFIYSFVIQVISEKALCSRDFNSNLKDIFYIKTIAAIIPRFSYKCIFTLVVSFLKNQKYEFNRLLRMNFLTCYSCLYYSFIVAGSLVPISSIKWSGCFLIIRITYWLISSIFNLQFLALKSEKLKVTMLFRKYFFVFTVYRRITNNKTGTRLPKRLIFCFHWLVFVYISLLKIVAFFWIFVVVVIL